MAINEEIAQVANFAVYAEGNRQIGLASVELGELNLESQEIKGSGIAGTIDLPTMGHFENIEVKLTWRSLYENPVKLLAQRAVMLSLRGAIERYDAATGELKILPVRIDVRSIPKGLNLGKFEPSELMESESTFHADYLKITIDGVVRLELDKFNFVANVDGTDYLTAVRSALGY